jgi:hypothetical protein
MIDERFSSERFMACGLDTPEAAALAEELQKEIELAMDDAVKSAFRNIAVHLNEMGHNLRTEEDVIGTLTFRDDWTDETGYHCKLRIGFDTVVSTGYAHLRAPGEPDPELDEEEAPTLN